MVSRRRRFNREFKIETVKLVTDSDNSVTQIAADMGIHPNTLYKWAKQYSDKPQEAFPGIASFRPGFTVCKRRLSDSAYQARHGVQQESHWQLLGQCAGRKFLRHPETGTCLSQTLLEPITSTAEHF